MLNKNTSTFLFLMTISICANAQMRDEEQLRQLALEAIITHRRENLVNAREQGDNLKLEKLKNSDELSVYGIKGKGFAVISHNRQFPAVLGVSEMAFSEEIDGLCWWMKAMNEALAAKRANGDGAEVFKKEKAVEQMLTTRWGQGSPYNYKTPEINGKNAPVGCVATALAQILNYLQYPASSKGKGYYTKENSQSQFRLSLNTTYTWGEYRDWYPDMGLTTNQKIGIATLMYDCGLACHMNYKESASGTTLIDAAQGMINNMRFDPYALKLASRDYHSNEDWMAMIYDALDHGRPILYSGTDPNTGGHAFVFDGYDEEGKIRVNWGWDGEGDGYYNFADLNPTGIFGVSVTSHFNSNQDMIWNYKCQEEPGTEESFESYWICNNYQLEVSKEDIVITPTYLYNNHPETFKGKLGIYVYNDDMSFSKFYEGLMTTEMDPGYGYTNNDQQVAKLNDVKPGTYHFYFGTKDDREAIASIVHLKGGAKIHTLTIDANRNITIDEQTIPYITNINNPIENSAEVISVKRYSMNGIESNETQKGIFIEKQWLSTGTVWTVKRIVR